MFYRTMIFLLLKSTAVSSINQGTTRKTGEYANIQDEVQFLPVGEDGLLADMNEIPSMHRCVHHCMFSELCRMVTYYEDSKTCRLYSVSSSRGMIQSRFKAKVIDLVDRSKERHAKYC